MKKLSKYFLYFIFSSAVFGLIGCQGLVSPLEPAGSDDVSIDILPKASSAPNRYIVTFGNQVSVVNQGQIIRGAGGTEIKNLSLINGKAVNLPAQAVAALQRTSGVTRVEIDRIVQIPNPRIDGKGGGGGKPDKKPPKGDPPPPPAESLPWGVDRIDADYAWTVSTGNAVKVGILDTGIDTDHPDLNVWGGINTTNPRKSLNFKDDNGHGTHVAGTVAAIDNEIGVIGVGHSVHLYAIKAFNRRGQAYLSDIIEGIDWCVANGIKVINMSYGASSASPSEQEAITAAYNSGIVMVAAAGNNGNNSVGYPAKYGETIAVSASDENNNIASFSNSGQAVDLIAPGVNILSTYRGSAYAIGSGTSMAAPHVTGSAALVLQMQPGLTPGQVKDQLKNAAEWLNGLTSEQQGAGLVDAAAAVGVIITNN